MSSLTGGGLRAAPLAVAAMLLAVTCAGCGGSQPAYAGLQSSIDSTLTKQEHLSVSSVACTPHVSDVSYGDGFVNESCVVRFANGSSYTTPATIEARSFQVTGYNYTWEDPPDGEAGAATVLPGPASSVGPTDPRSLFVARNLSRVVSALARRFDASQLILSLDLYPGGLEAVIGANGTSQLVTAGPSGPLAVGHLTAFSGDRTGITISQLDPTVPEQLARLIAAHGGVPTAELRRFELISLPGNLAGWNISVTSGQTRFQAHLQGDALEEITPTGTRSLN